LTDAMNFPNRWTFPLVELAPQQHLVVFASGKDRTPAAGELHTSFKLGADAEFLALLRPNGSIAPDFRPH
jgi:hypothetical protein